MRRWEDVEERRNGAAACPLMNPSQYVGERRDDGGTVLPVICKAAEEQVVDWLVVPPLPTPSTSSVFLKAAEIDIWVDLCEQQEVAAEEEEGGSLLSASRWCQLVFSSQGNAK